MSDTNLPTQISEAETLLNNIDPEMLTRQELGSKDFEGQKNEFIEIKSMIHSMIEGFKANNEIYGNLRIANEVRQAANGLKSQYDNFNRYTLKDPDNTRNSAISSFTNWLTSLYSGVRKDGSQYHFNNFITTYSILSPWAKIKANQTASSQFDSTDFKQKLKDLKKHETEVNKIVENMRIKAADESVRDYSMIFRTQSEKHSKLSGTWYKPVTWKFGEAQKWLIGGIISGIVLIQVINNLDSIFTWSANDTTEIQIIQMISRFAVVSFMLYLIAFCFKQYSVNKHLFTINKHRQNTLDSYELFISSLSSEDGALKDALMMEVAKSIYESGNTGYLSAKHSENNTPSIIELTRLINNKGSGN